MANLVMFCILAVVILGSAVMCVMTKSIMRSATYLLLPAFTSCLIIPILVQPR